MKIATLATGGIGGFLAVRLTDGGHQVATIARGQRLEAIKEMGFLLMDRTVSRQSNHGSLPMIQSKLVRWTRIIFGVKGDALEAAAHACLPMMGSDTVVVPFLNGVEAADRLAQFLPEQNVANGVAQISTTISMPGVIKQTGTMNNFLFAERDSQASVRIEKLRDAINDAGSSAPPTDDIERDLWQKFVFFSAVSGVTAAARCTLGDITANSALSDLFKDVVSETAALAGHGAFLCQTQSKKVYGPQPPVCRQPCVHQRPLI